MFCAFWVIDAGPTQSPPTMISEDLVHMADPIGIRTKGSSKRLKSSKEKAMEKKKRACSHCHTPGHTVRTCPKLQSSSRLMDEDSNGGNNDDDIYRVDVSNMASGVESNSYEFFYTGGGLDDYNDTVLRDVLEDDFPTNNST